MKTHIRVTGAGLPHAAESPELIARLSLLYPEGVTAGSFSMNLPADDPRTISILQELSSCGLRPWEDHSRKREPGEYTVDYHREYDDSDFVDVELVQLAPWVHLSCKTDNDRDAEGRIQIECHKPSLPKDPIATDRGSGILVREHVKQMIESIDPKHVEFRETTLVTWWDIPPKRMEWAEKNEEPWWEMSSNLVLPPMSPSMTLLDVRTFERLDRGTDRFCFARDPDEPRDREAQFHFCRSEIDRLGPFDGALTHECLGSSRTLVLSARVYRVLTSAGVRSRWIPCRIEDC